MNTDSANARTAPKADWPAIRERARAVCLCEELDMRKADAIGPGEDGEGALIAFAVETGRSLDWLVKGGIPTERPVSTDRSKQWFDSHRKAQSSVMRLWAMSSLLDNFVMYSAVSSYPRPDDPDCFNEDMSALCEGIALLREEADRARAVEMAE